MRGKIKSLGIAVVIMMLIVSFSACSFWNKSGQQNGDSKKTTQASENEKKLKITEDTDKTAQLKKEKPILNGKVYVQNNRAIATMVIKKGTSDKEAKDLAQKYANDLKKKYKNMQVNVMAVRDNKNIANITVK
jgi:ABC-type lipoprotein release transport system permease subunit